MNNSFKCLEKCGFCCSFVFILKETYEKHKDKFQKPVKVVYQVGNEVGIITFDRACAFLTDDKRCAIYEDRPEVCKQFGETKQIPCPYLKPNGNPRSQADKKKILRAMKKQTKDFLRNKTLRRISPA